MNKIVNYFRQLELKEATRFLVIFYIVGIIGFLLPQTRDLFQKLIPLSLIVNLFMLFLFHRKFDKKHLLFFLGVVAFTIAVEAVGVKTGWLFGEYVYGNSLALKIAETPVLIGFNWLMLSYGAVYLVRSRKGFRKFVPVGIAILMTGYDFIMEPVAMKTDMWTWSFNTVPLQNYIMWFIVSAILGAAFELLRIDTNNKLAGRIFVMQLVFFGVLNLFL